MESPTDCVMWYMADMNTPDFRLCKPIWGWSKRYCMGDDTVRQAQRRQFEIETAAADAATAAPRKSTSNIQLVQTEDEHGRVVD